MKKIVLLIIGMFTLSIFSAQAGKDTPIEFSQLPAKAQTFIKDYFPDKKVSYAKIEKGFFDTSYEVVLASGDKIDFFEDGDWKEVDCKYAIVPIAIIPEAIKSYLKTNYPDQLVVEIERKSNKSYEIKLDNSIEIEFNKEFKVVDIDF